MLVRTVLVVLVVATAVTADAGGSTLAGILALLAGKIKHVVVLMEENRSFDHLFGFAKALRVDGLSGKEFNYINTSNPAQGKVRVGKNARYVNPCDPNHGTPATAAKIKGDMGGFVNFESDAGHGGPSLNYCDVMSSFEPSAIPVITALASEFAVMDKMFRCNLPPPTRARSAPSLTALSLPVSHRVSAPCDLHYTPTL